MPMPLGGQLTAHCDVVGVGVNTVDVLAVGDAFPAPDTKHELRALIELPGGETATALAACARLGWRARYVGRFGSDLRGQTARVDLANSGVDVSSCTTAAAAQAVSVIFVDNQGRRTVLWSRSRELDLQPADVDPAVVTAGRILLCDAHQPEAATHAARCARTAGIPTILDIDSTGAGRDALLRETDILITSADFPEAFTGKSALGAALRALAGEFRPRLVCTTLGRHGSLSLVEDREIRTEGFDVPVVDSTGAGDAFRGGFVAGWLASAGTPQVEAVLTYANAVAALACRRLGARSGLPTVDEVARLLSSNRRTT
ncbi:MAG: PfkB family carbohydrate kinase [Acidobacteria bacterium]|nr:PfkB family carbohydrate kinase [Acidobacteriota bacterium]